MKAVKVDLKALIKLLQMMSKEMSHVDITIKQGNVISVSPHTKPIDRKDGSVTIYDFVQ